MSSNEHMNRTAEWMQWEKARNDYDTGYLQGFKNGKNAAWNVKQVKEPDQRTNQLLNELYHDRARLERVVTDAVNTMEAVLDLLDGTSPLSKDTLYGTLCQFVDTHQSE